jgi:dimethylargininase
MALSAGLPNLGSSRFIASPIVKCDTFDFKLIDTVRDLYQLAQKLTREKKQNAFILFFGLIAADINVAFGKIIFIRGAGSLFTKAIVRIPGSNFDAGLTTVDFGRPELDLVLAQHQHYCRALEECGLALTTLDADLRFPDSTFVEDTAVLTPQGAVLMRPGAASREGEVEAIREIVLDFFPHALTIEAPGTVDGGDICETENHFFIGLSHRTNEEGARQLAAHLAGFGYASSTIDVRPMTLILHLKSGISYIGDNTLAVMEEMADNPQFRGHELIKVAAEESYAANCVRVNHRVLTAAGFPNFTAELQARGFDPLILDMSEFQKMDGGLSCLSLRF